MTQTKANSSALESPSRTLLSFAEDFLQAKDRPILDVGCGFGRNAVALAMRGASVVCLDLDSDRLRSLMSLAPQFMADSKHSDFETGNLYPVCADADCWPFPQQCFSTVICVHLVKRQLFDVFRNALAPGGHLYVETFGGQGRNYVDLPKAGEFRSLLSPLFDLRLYRERKVGPRGYDAVSVTLLGQKR